MPRARGARNTAGKSVETLRHEGETRTNIPTAEYQPLVREEDSSPLRVAYQRRNRDLDPQLVWWGKDEQDLADLVVSVPPGIVYQFVTKGTVERKRAVGRLEIPVAGSLKDNVIAGLSSGI